MSLPESPGMGRILAALGTSKENEPIRAPVAPAELKINHHVLKAKQRFNPEIGKKIVSVVQAGNTREVACASAGISMSVFTHWAKLAMDGEEPFMSFMEQLDQAEAGLEAVLVAIIRQKAQEDPHVAFKLLERRFPQRWAANASPAVNINMANQNQMTPADARQVMRDLFGDLSPKRVIDAPKTDDEGK